MKRLCDPRRITTSGRNVSSVCSRWIFTTITQPGALTKHGSMLFRTFNHQNYGPNNPPYFFIVLCVRCFITATQNKLRQILKKKLWKIQSVWFYIFKGADVHGSIYSPGGKYKIFCPGNHTFPSLIFVPIICRLCWIISMRRSHSSVNLASWRDALTYRMNKMAFIWPFI